MATIEVVDTKKVVNEFNEKSGGVKALVDSGVVKIPEVFVHPPGDLPNETDSNGKFNDEFPIIDLEGETRSVTVEQIRKASKTWGFFQVVNHGIPPRVLDEMIQGVRRFHEQTKEGKMIFVSHYMSSGLKYHCASDSFMPKAAVWRDTLMYYFNEDQLDSEILPLVCREILFEYVGWIIKLKDILCELLSEALGLRRDYLKHIECTNNGTWAGHYYPACPEPEMTIGTTKHTDHSTLTILLQDEIGGLQVLNQNHWNNASPIKGALIVNIGDFLQVMSNDKFKSVFHRVLARPIGPRISVPIFFFPKDRETQVIGPINELLCEDDPPVYNKISFDEYLNFYTSKKADGTSGLQLLKL